MWGVLALGLAAAGAVVLLVADRPRTDYGWFAYTELDVDGAVAPGTRFVTETQLLGAGLAAAGVVLVALWVGFWLGSRRVARGG
ncbi:hypothetical protein GCM10023340_11000 [Nocardioides marinquilinus]|uniref:Uncharacterized protein n=1 Tax=Nocardioides marinquilinus TaxID=1210400 RepID=A0ABP9PDJ8_9ACTN